MDHDDDVNSIEEEDEMEMVTTSLAEVLTCRDRFLEDRELWALCRECCLTLEYVHDCYDLFQSLCINPDTVAFDPEGNVCFLDLDMDPDPLYIAPETAEHGISYKTHLYSLGMTLLFASEYNTQSADPKAKLSEGFLDLLTSLTCDSADRRADLDTVIGKCERALKGQLSQVICLNIVGLRGGFPTPSDAPGADGSSVFQMTGELSAYLESQSGLVQNRSVDSSLLDDSKPSNRETPKHNSSNVKGGGSEKHKDHNDNCIPNRNSDPSRKSKGLNKLNIIKDVMKEANLDEEEIMSLNEEHSTTTPRNSKRQGMMLADMLQSLGRFLNEAELWALCRECVLCLKRKKKHLPAYVSLDTVMICDTGMVTFKAIPEDKPLEVVYMAPELQQKGILNEKTCLYGLGITLKSAAGVDIASPSLPIPDGEALEILIQSFLQAKPERRPALDTAFEMCQEYEKSSETKSRDVCLAFYNESLSRVALDKSCISPSISTSEMSHWDSSNKDSSKWDSSEQEQTRTSSDNTQSIFQGDVTEPEDNIEDIPFDAEDKAATASEQPTAFKPIMAHNASSSLSSSAFKPLPSKPRPVKEQYRVPSAFSSPATHFKPIVLHESQAAGINEQLTKGASKSGKQDVDVVAKLREIKQNLMKHRNTDISEKDLPSSENSSSTIKKKSEEPTGANDSSNLSSYMKQLTSQGSIPDTDTLASAIAKYLKNEFSDSSQSQSVEERRFQPSNMPVNNNQPPVHSNLQSSHYDPNMSNSYPQNYNSPNQMHPQTSHPLPPLHQSPHSIPSSMAGANQAQMPYNHQSVPNMQQYPGHFAGVAPQNVPSFQVTLVQDPVSGLMQMVPVPYIQVPNQHPIPPPPQQQRHATSIHGPTVTTHPTTGALLYHGDGRTVHTNPVVSYGYQTYNKLDSYQHSNAVQNANTTNVQNFQSNFKSTPPIGTPVRDNRQPHLSNHNQDGASNIQQEADDSNSRSSSPSPSKDSGICLTQQPAVLPYSKEALIDRFLSSESSHRKKCLSQILNAVRGEFADDGVFDGVEDLAMAEYIVSLISLKWDTFCNAVKEKYPTLAWSQELLVILYEILNSSSESRHGNKYDPSPRVPSSSIDKTKTYKPDPLAESAFVSKGKPHSQLQTSSLTASYAPRVQSHGDGNIPQHGASLGPNTRPRSELAVAPRIMSSEASDSTDSENLEKRRRFRKRYELDKKKSSSLHNVFHAANSSVLPNSLEKQHFPLTNKQQIPDSKQRNPSVFSKDYYSSTTHTDNDSRRQHDFLNASHPPPNHRPSSQSSNMPSEPSHPFSHAPNSIPDTKPQNQAPPVPHRSHKDTSNPKYNSSIPGVQHGKPFQILPSKASCDNPSSLYDYGDSSSSNSPKEYRNTQKSNSNSQQKFLSPFNVPLTDSPSSTYSQLRKNKSMQNSTSKSLAPLAGDHSIPGPYTTDKKPSDRHDRLQPHQRHSLSYMEYNDENTSDSDYNASAEMRRLAAKKPELFERRTPVMSTPIDKNGHDSNNGSSSVSNKRPMSMVINDGNDSSLSGSKYNINDVVDLRTQGQQQSGDTKSKQDHENNRYFDIRQEQRRTSNNTRYPRSMSAVYTSQTPRSGVQVLDKSFDETLPRHADDSDDLPDINSALLPYTKKGQVVYHSAMIQLSLTADVDSFIHSIDEEDKSHIESRLASVTQEINMQWRQRKKSQRFYRRLSEQHATSKASKNDQNIGGQVLKDMAEMTRKINYLFLCKTHLQMLLAELDGLDVCYLHSLSACDHKGTLILQSLMENKYLQFRTINTQQAGSMSVLQAGTPKGLLSYLYTSSALSDGFIHQFLLCFRYILTADQMFHFIVDTYKSAQRSNQSDVNMTRIQHRSLDLLQFWVEGYFSVDFASNSYLTKRLAIFLQEQTEANIPGTDNIYSLYAACRLGEHSELMLMTEIEEDDEQDSTYFLHIANPKQSREERLMEWESFRSLLKRSKSDKSLNTSGGSGKLKSSDSNKALSSSTGFRSSSQFSLADCEVHVLAEQLTLLEQKLFRNCHPVHFLNSQFQGVGVALSMPGMRTPSMSRKMEPSEPKRGLFVNDPKLEPSVVRMITHSQELSHWVSAEILSCGSTKVQTNFVSKFIGVANMCLSVRNFATALSILEGLDNLVVRQLPVWKNISAKYISIMEELNDTKMKLKSESMWMTKAKDFHIYPTIPCVLFAALHLQQMEVGGFTLANGFFKWDKMRSISETVDQIRIFRDHEYGFHADPAIQRAVQRRLSEFSDQDLHAVASTHENNFHRSLSSSSSLSGTLRKVKDKIMKK